ncbi:MAG: diacylglycerol kinase family protein [Candidatus Caenarcaniphilales bacterium]|nr:diacylglycerol kinase family protein [Candidatus Caenarcaniphilales bacterium]
MEIDILKLFKSLSYAFQGLKQSIIREQNFRIELSMGLIAILMGFLLRINFIEWIWVINSIVLVLSFELINTSIERLTDLASDKRKTGLARQAKDIAAAGVLITVFQSIIAAMVIFLPKIIKML